MKIIFFKKNKKIGRSMSGFTLVESLIAVSIFSVSIIAMMSVLGGGIANTNYVKNKLVATYLAQEGIEYARNMRDKHILYDGSAGWDNFLKIEDFNYSSSVAGFDVNITKENLWTDSVRIISVASWTQGVKGYNVTLTSELFNWVE